MHVEVIETPPADLAGMRNGSPERFVPTEMRGDLIEAEHLARYRWASTIAAGRRVLDAGCGTAYGAAMLADAGACEVVGVDLAESVLEAVRPQMPDTVRLETGDLRDLGYDDASFDLVVCFEVIEHFADPFTVLDELTRVLAPDGVLLVSSPNRHVSPPGNPHHLHEFVPDELASELRKRVRNVRLMRQHDYVTAAVLTDEAYATAAEQPLDGMPVHKLVHGERDREMFTLAIASAGPLPEISPFALLTSPISLRDWIGVLEEQERTLQAHRRYIRELEGQVVDRDEVQRRLIEAEQELAEVPDLEATLGDKRAELEQARAELEHTRLDLDRCRRAHAAVLGSPSWRITKPLRLAKQLLRSRM